MPVFGIGSEKPSGAPVCNQEARVTESGSPVAFPHAQKISG